MSEIVVFGKLAFYWKDDAKYLFSIKGFVYIQFDIFLQLFWRMIFFQLLMPNSDAAFMYLSCCCHPCINYVFSISSLGFEYVAGDKPPVVAAKDASGLKYRMPEVSDAKEFMPSLKEFLTQMQAGSLEPYLKSEAVPDNSANAVKVAVAKNFDELVTKSEKDVLVEFYAPW